ncbi:MULTISPECIES: glutathione S-transferase family protein [Spirulina sp. CCY15215]|uniref:glutathione S-transferase family protein n=1 Tax=Spirulina sp. CCY15215 TaxID=2767591 RepID=UPI00194F0376|nr:glutathione S-transferase family protein [Spirulina major]
MFKLYQSQPSGNCYKIRLLLTQLDIPFEKIEIDIFQKESRTSAFLEKNLNGRVPVLETENRQFLPESNAVLYYLSDGTNFFPQDRFERAQVMQWLFFEQYSHEPYIATSRYWISLLGKPEEYRAQLEQKREPGYAALRVMEKHLGDRDFFVGNNYSIADIALFAYTHVADEGGFDLSEFSSILTWIERIKAQPKYISIKE